MSDTIDVEPFDRDGVVMFRLPDGTEMRAADYMRAVYPEEVYMDAMRGLTDYMRDATDGREYDVATGAMMAARPPRADDPTPATPREEYSFGDTGNRTLRRTIDDVSAVAGAGGEITRSMLPEDWRQTFPDAMLAAGDYGLAGLMGLLGGVETAAGYAGDVAEGVQNVTGLGGRYAPGGSAKALQADLMGMFDAAGAAPEGRIMAAISAARPTGTARGLLSELGTNEYGGVPIPGANTVDPAIAQAEEVLSLIRSGRADEVTRDMLDMGDDVLNARLNEHLWNNYDLPMDEASRMERARGFQGGLYSGTGDNFTAFSGQSWATDNPDLAYTYAPSVGGSVMPLMMRAKHGAPVVNAGGANWNALTPSMREGGPQAPYLRGILTDPEDLAKYGEDLLTTQNFADAAKEQGFSGVTFNDVVDVGGYLSKYFPEGPQRDAQRASVARAGQPSKVEMRLYPNQVRSRFARFDPRLRHLDNLNAALAAGAPLGLLAMQPDEEY